MGEVKFKTNWNRFVSEQLSCHQAAGSGTFGEKKAVVLAIRYVCFESPLCSSLDPCEYCHAACEFWFSETVASLPPVKFDLGLCTPSSSPASDVWVASHLSRFRASKGNGQLLRGVFKQVEQLSWEHMLYRTPCISILESMLSYLSRFRMQSAQV
jgi:hypothetical protein